MDDLQNNQDRYGHLPKELIDFFMQTGGRSLIIKGGPGTGKTTFALELTEAMKEKFNTQYISSRVDEVALSDHFPWLNKNIIQKENTFFSERKTNLKGQEGQTLVNRSELDKLEARVESGEEFLEGEEESGKENAHSVENGYITFDMATILPEIDVAYEAVELALPRKSLVIIDSIEALSEKYGISSRRLMFTLQKDLVEHTKTNVVFILEKEDHTDLEFLSDGVLKLEMAEYKNRRLRRMNMVKLRGVKIGTPALLFTLLGGHFTFLNANNISVINMPYPDTSGDKDTDISSNSLALDALLYDIVPGSVNLFEMGDGVDTSVIKRILIKRIISSISRGYGVYVLPPERVSINEIEKELSNFQLDTENKNCLKYLEMAEMGGNLSTPNIIPIEGESIRDDFRWDAISHNLFSLDTPYTSIVSFDTLKSIYGSDSYLGLIRHISMLRKNGGTFFGFGWSTSEETKKFSNYAHTHIKIDTIDKSTIIFGERPYTGLNFLPTWREEQNNDLSMKLIPIL